MKKQSQQKLKKCLGIFQIISAFIMIAIGCLAVIAFIFNRLIYKGSDLYITWTGEVLFTFIYCILTAVIGSILMFLGKQMTGSYIVIGESGGTMPIYRGQRKELWIAILNILFILLSVSVLIVRLGSDFVLSVFLFCALPLMPSVVLVILAFVLFGITRKDTQEVSV